MSATIDIPPSVVTGDIGRPLDPHTLSSSSTSIPSRSTSPYTISSPTSTSICTANDVPSILNHTSPYCGVAFKGPAANTTQIMHECCKGARFLYPAQTYVSGAETHGCLFYCDAVGQSKEDLQGCVELVAAAYNEEQVTTRCSDGSTPNSGSGASSVGSVLKFGPGGSGIVVGLLLALSVVSGLL